MRGLSQGSDSGNFAARVMFEASTTKRSRTDPTNKFINAIHTAFDSLAFDERDWAYVFSLSHHRVQRRFLNALVQYFAILAERCDSGLWVDEEEMLLVKDGKAIHQALRFLDN